MKLHSFRRPGFGLGVVLLLAAGSLQAADPAGTGLNPKPNEALTIALAKLPAGAKPVEFVLMPAGSFRMGCELTERGRVGREFHPHEVTITRPFYFGRYEVTQAQWWVDMWWGGNNGQQGYPQGCKAVGLKAPNPWGVHDPHGNVWEWCSDWWGDPEHRGPQRDPQGPPTGTLKVMRGGAWESHALHLRSADRSPIAPDAKDYGRLIGFRLVRDWP